jgi:two-component system LytT family response regulator
VRSVGRNDLVPVSDIHWIEAVGYYVRLHAASTTLLHRESMESLARRLDPAVFARVHRSSIVRVDAIRRTRRNRSGNHEVTLSSGQRVVVSRAGWSTLRGRVAETAHVRRGRA